MYLIKNKLLETISPVFVLNFHSLKIVCAQALQHVVSHESLLNKHLGHRPKKFGNHCTRRLTVQTSARFMHVHFGQ